MTIQRAALLYDQQRYEQAAEETRRILASDPDDATAHALLSLALTRLERLEEATYEAQAAIGAAPDLPLGHVAEALALVGRNQFARARRAASEAIRLEPSDPDNFSVLAQVELANRKWAAAYEATTRGLAIVGDHAELLQARSAAAAHLGRLGEAEDASTAALRTRPDEPRALAARGYQLMHAGKFREARDAFTSALRLDATNELAQAGLVETIKATNPIYRVILRFFLWTSRLPTWQQLLLVFAGPAVYRALRNTFQANPSTQWLLGPLVAVWLTILLSTWLAMPLSNLALFLHPLGRHALTDEERLEASMIGGLVVAAIVGLAAFAAGADGGLFLAIGAAAAAVTTSAAFRAESGWPRRILAAFAVTVVVTGAAGATLAFIRPEGIGDGSPAWVAFGITIGLTIVVTWLAQWLTRVQPAR